MLFEDIKGKANTLLSLTGYILEEFTALLPHFSKCFLDYMETHTLEGKPRKKRKYKPYKNSRFASHEDMLLFILIYIHEAPKQVLFGILFGMAQSLTNKWIHLLLPILNTALAELGEVPSRETVPTSMGDTSEVSTQSQEGELFFMMASNGQYCVQKTQKLKRCIIAAKRNVIQLRINLQMHNDTLSIRNGITCREVINRIEKCKLMW